jgi:predicted DNA-binding antitoxin AbrB/MazE fold protein
MSIHQGIYENGVVRPLTPLALPESTPVSIVVPAMVDSVPEAVGTDADEIYEILNRRYRSGHTDTAARVDELDP